MRHHAMLTLLYVLTILLDSFVDIIILLSANFFMGSSILDRSCLDHMIFPETGGALRGIGGLFLCFS